MHDHFRVAGRLKNRSAMLQLLAQLDRVSQVAVVPQRDFSFVAVNHHRLRVRQYVVACGGIPRVADGGVAGQPRNHFRREDFLHDAPAICARAYLRAVGGGDAGGFLPAMLQRVKSQVGHLRGFGWPNIAEHAAMIVKMIVVEVWIRYAHAFSMAFASDSLHDSRGTIRYCLVSHDAPLYWMRKSPRATVPICCARTLYCAAIALTRASEAGATDTTARAPRSPKSAASRQNHPRPRHQSKFPPTARRGQSTHSASVTASPPSLTSCAEKTSRSLASFHQAIDQSLFRSEINRRRRSRHNSVNRLRIFARTKSIFVAAAFRPAACVAAIQHHNHIAFVAENPSRARTPHPPSTPARPKPAWDKSACPEFRCKSSRCRR